MNLSNEAESEERLINFCRILFSHALHSNRIQYFIKIQAKTHEILKRKLLPRKKSVHLQGFLLEIKSSNQNKRTYTHSSTLSKALKAQRR